MDSVQNYCNYTSWTFAPSLLTHCQFSAPFGWLHIPKMGGVSTHRLKGSPVRRQPECYLRQAYIRLKSLLRFQRKNMFAVNKQHV
jgi:hypothetical protein